MNVVFYMFENAVSESMGYEVRLISFPGKRRRTPEIACFFVTQIKSFTTGITNRVVVPRCNAVFMCIDGPCIGRAGFRNYCSEQLIRQYINPWSRCGFIFIRDDSIFLSILSKAACAIKEQKVIG